MAKTLVALYDSVMDAERVVQELSADGFAPRDIHLVRDHPQGRETPHASVERDAAYAGVNLVDTLTDEGVPYDEALAYMEGVRRGGALVVVESSDDRAERGMAILRQLHPVNIHERTAQWRQEGWAGADAHTTTAPATPGTPGRYRAPQHGTDDREVTIPVVEEDLSVGTREVEHGHVRISSRVTEHPVEQSVRLREEKVRVERRPADRPATADDFTAAEQDVIELTETAEEPVVSKRARVVEEVVVHKEVAEHTETVRGTARHSDVEVQRAPEDATALQGFAAYDATCRRHYTTTFAQQPGATFDTYLPAYRYGYTLATDPRYRTREWALVEPDARRDWERDHPGTWERFTAAMRHAWEEVRGQR